MIDFDYKNEKWAFNVNLLQNRGADLSSRSGQLSLQDHGDPVWYRNIKMRQLRQEESINHKIVTPERVSDEVLQAERLKLEGILERRKQLNKK